MTFHDKNVVQVLEELNSNEHFGLTAEKVLENRRIHGQNVLTEKKGRNFFQKVFDALKEPMLIILLFGLILTFGTNLGKLLKSGEGDFTECIGILLAVTLSVSITLIMEGSSQKAFKALSKIYEKIIVKVVRDGVTLSIPQNQIVVGDIILLESGDKIVADGRLIDSNSLSVDESALTGESLPVKKSASTTLTSKTPLAERVNCVYSGTFVSGGTGKMIVTATGDNTEMGGVAGELAVKAKQTPLEQKLSKLGKVVTIVGAVTATLVCAVSAVRLIMQGTFTFSSLQDLFISSIVLIVAAVPEGLPTIVAVSLALNMVKLAKENALIKKMSATETTGAVSVICSDKTGTLTENKMKVISICKNKACVDEKNFTDEVLKQNFVCNSTAEVIIKNKRVVYRGSATEGALIKAYIDSEKGANYNKFRAKFKVVERQPFSSETKFMSTTIDLGDKHRVLLKGAPEVVLDKCNLSVEQNKKIIADMARHQQKARRVIAFAHKDTGGGFVFDGFAALADPVRKDVFKAVQDCSSASIKVKILTGDNFETAFAIAKELGIAQNESQVVTAKDIENLSNEELKNVLNKITVIARSTPILKLRVVKALRSMGEVVAVTGDGINDAPAIKQADVGIAMGINGSDITKEAADIVLLDDSFSTVVKAVAFGRNVFKNLQRFIVFQLSVNLSALLFVTVCALTGMSAPFNTLQLLWINVIMDGPPALTLGLGAEDDDLMKLKPVSRNANIISKNMLVKIIFNALFVGTVMTAQYFTDFLKVGAAKMSGTIFTLFIIFQLFNAFNSTQLGSKSIFKSIGKNKIMAITFLGVLVVHFCIVQFFPSVFGVCSLGTLEWVKTILTASTIIIVSELAKAAYRIFDKSKRKRVSNKLKSVKA